MATGSMAFLNPYQNTPNPTPGNTFSSPNIANNLSPPPPMNRTPNPAQSPNDLVGAFVNERDETSLYQTCIKLRRRLAFVPGFEPYLREMDQEEMESGEETDPVTSMWNMLRQGLPLLAIYNATNPPQKLEINRARVKEPNVPKAAAFKFLQACLADLKIPQDQCFLVTDLYGQDTTGFVKVLSVIIRVVDVLQARGLLFQSQEDANPEAAAEPQQKSHAEMIVSELVTTERNYVQHLETLKLFKDQLEQSGALPGDTIHDIFLNLNNLLDFQQRFLIRIEQQNALDPAMQNWGQLFVQYQEGFRVYEPFIGNQHHGNETVTKHWNTIEKIPYTPKVQGMVGSVTVLTGFLLKPFQRLSKYPLLLEEMRKRGENDPQRTEDLVAGSSAMKMVLDRANALLQKADLAKEVAELVTLVDDWKGHQLSHFGDLVLSGTFPVVKGESSKDSQRDYKIFLFERILLCCKEINPNKTKNRLQGKSSTTKQGKLKLQLKGRIFIQNICDVVQLQPSQNGSPSYTLQIWWKGDPGIESFTIRFPAADPQKKWFDQILTLRNQFPSNRGNTNSSDMFQPRELVSMSGLTLENPYGQDDDSGDDGMSMATTLVNDGSSYASFNQSSSSIGPGQRSRSGTNSSRGAAPPRFPMAEPPMASAQPQQLQQPQQQPPPPQQQQPPQPPGLRLATGQIPGTPEDRNGASAFSPVGESPNSSRISQASQPGSYPFPRQSSASNMQWSHPGEPNKHNTAPAMARPPYGTPEGEAGPPYMMNGRSLRGPSLPAGPSHGMPHAPSHGASHSTSQLPTSYRGRSISSPDVNGYSPGGRRTPNSAAHQGGEDVPVPPIPPHMTGMRNPVNRSNTNSPTDSLRKERGIAPNQATGLRPTYQHQHYNSYAYDQPHGVPKNANSMTMTGAGRVLSPPMSAGGGPNHMQQQQSGPNGNGAQELPYVSQLKVKIHYDPDPETNYVSIVIGSNIGWETLRGRIDHKMQKNTKSQIAEGTARLKYMDAENDMVTVEEDEDVDMAIEVWKEKYRNELFDNKFPELDLYWKELVPKK